VTGDCGANRIPTVDERSLSIIAFSLFSAWLLAFPFEGQVLYAMAAKHGIDISTMVFGAVAAHLAGLFACGFFVKNLAAARRTMLLSTAVCLAGSLVFYLPVAVVWPLTLAAISLAAGFFIAAWGFFFRRYTPPNARLSTAADVLICSNLLMIFLNVTTLHTSPAAGHTLGIAMQAASLLLTARLQASEPPSLFKPAEAINPTPPLTFLCLFIIILTVNSGLMYQVINPAFAHHTTLVTWYWAVPYIAALYIVKKLPPSSDRTYLLYIGIAMIGLAFLSFMVLDRSVTSYLIVDTLLLGACGVYDLFWWSILGEMLDYDANPAKILGIGLSANVLGVLLGGMLGHAITAVDAQSSNPSLIAIAIVFVILIILPPLNKHLSLQLKGHAFLAVLAGMAAARSDQAVDEFIRNCELTERESEIAALLLQGRTYKMIADELYLSVNTVKTHIKNIYSKFNIRSKAELVKLLTEHENTLSG